jgi:arginine decarboxylase
VWTIDDASELYNVEGWGIGYFGVNSKGHLGVHPTRDPKNALDLFELAMDMEAQGVKLPLLLRFSDILRTRVQTLAEKFQHAIQEYDYEGRYTTVYEPAAARGGGDPPVRRAARGGAGGGE